MEKIRLTKDLPWAKAGEEFDVYPNGTRPNEGSFIRITFLNLGSTAIMLSELEGWYEEVKWEPKEEQELFFMINAFGVVCGRYGHDGNTSPADVRSLIKFGNCFQTKEEAERVLYRVKEVLKK